MPTAASSSPDMIEDRLTLHFDSMTPSERNLASHLTRHYPVAGLETMSRLAQDAGVSIPTVLRLVQKLGFKGYPEFQAQLRTEVEARLESPLSKRARWSNKAPQTHILNRFADAVLTNMTVTLERIDYAEFDACVELLADQNRHVYVVGGRITHALADYLVTQLGLVRPRVSVLQGVSNSWPPALLDMQKGDVLVVFDIRRYESTIQQLAEMAAEKGVCIVLMTDPWVSPVTRHATYRFSVQIEVPSAWDSSASMMVLLETMLAAVQERTWPETEARMNRLEQLYERASMFRRGTKRDT